MRLRIKTLTDVMACGPWWWHGDRKMLFKGLSESYDHVGLVGLFGFDGGF